MIVRLTKEEVQALLDAVDTMDGAKLTPVTADLVVFAQAVEKLERAQRKAGMS